MTVAGAFHLLLHLLVPLLLAKLFAGKQWRSAFYCMLATMLVDLDHLLATPMYSPDRCSINFHPLHLWPVWIIYGVVAAVPKSRWIGIGLLLHMLLDAIDCVRQQGFWALVSGFERIW